MLSSDLKCLHLTVHSSLRTFHFVSPLNFSKRHGNEFRAAGLFHGDSVEDVGGFHGSFGVGDDDELRFAGHLPEEADEALVVDLVERRVDLVQDAERARLVAEDREEQGESREGTLTSRQQRDRLCFLAGRLGDQLDPALEDVVFVEELHLGDTAAEE